MRTEFLILDKIEGPLIILSGVEGVAYGEMVNIRIRGSGEEKKGKVVLIDDDKVVVQVFGSTTGFSVGNTCVRFSGRPLDISLSPEMLGRTFNGIGQPIDGGGGLYSGHRENIGGRPINPVARLYPRDFIQTGISSIDLLLTLIRGQKLPIFSGSGLPHNELAAQIAKQAKIVSGSGEDFAVVFAAMGVKHDDANFFRHSFERTGVSEKVVMYVNTADNPIVERIATPRCALTAAEYLAFELGMHILVILTDMTNYCEALREISSAREEVPSRKGYPGYLYSDLASLYERAGMIKGKKGSITQIPILTMPNDDITHPIPDLTGFITEGQVVLSRDLYQRDVYPPINVLPSLSRLMKDGIGKGYTREDHQAVAERIFSAYSRVREIADLAQVIGEDELSEEDHRYLEFGRQFEERFLRQRADENRDLLKTLELAWELLAVLPEDEINQMSPEILKKYYGK